MATGYFRTFLSATSSSSALALRKPFGVSLSCAKSNRASVYLTREMCAMREKHRHHPGTDRLDSLRDGQQVAHAGRSHCLLSAAQDELSLVSATVELVVSCIRGLGVHMAHQTLQGLLEFGIITLLFALSFFLGLCKNKMRCKS